MLSNLWINAILYCVTIHMVTEDPVLGTTDAKICGAPLFAEDTPSGLC